MRASQAAQVSEARRKSGCDEQRVLRQCQVAPTQKHALPRGRQMSVDAPDQPGARGCTLPWRRGPRRGRRPSGGRARLRLLVHVRD
eukprot:6185243-Pleurochrysis_carterae.AAC.2